MASSGITTALVFMCMLTLVMGLGQLSIDNITNWQGSTFNGCGKLFQEAYSSQTFNSSTDLDSNNLKNGLPGSATTTPGATNGFFVVDWIAAASNYIGGHINTFTEIVSGPYCALHSIPNIPPQFVTIISAMWYTIGLLLLAAFIIGR